MQFLNFNWTFHVGGSYAIYQFLLWICSNSKFFEVTGSIFLSAWGVRNFLSLLVSVHYMHPTKAFSIAFWDINIDIGLKCNYMGKYRSCFSGTQNKVIFLVHEFGSLKEGGKLCFTPRGLTFTIDTRFFRLLLHMLYHHIAICVCRLGFNVIV